MAKITTRSFQPHQIDYCISYWKSFVDSCKGTDLNPYFVAAQGALESGWGKKAIGNNLFGITATSSWSGKRKTVTTHEYHRDDKQGSKYKKVHSITPVNTINGLRYKYVVDRDFRDYDSVADCLRDHFKILSLPRYKAAFEHKDNIKQFALMVAKLGYCTEPAESYAASISSIAGTISRIVTERKL